MGTKARNGQFINMNPEQPSQDKQTRARSIQARMRAGKVKFNKSASWWDDLQTEMIQFPKAVHDDQVDALAWIGLTLDKLMDAPTEDEWEDEEYNREFGGFAFAGGRSTRS